MMLSVVDIDTQMIGSYVGLFLLGLLTIYIGYIIYHLIVSWDIITKFPGSYGFLLPFIGDLPQVLSLGIKYGASRTLSNNNDLYVTWLGHQPVLLIGSVNILKDYYFHHMTDRPIGLGMGYYFEQWLGQCLGCLTGKLWGKTKGAFRILFEIDNNKKMKLFNNIIKQWQSEMFDNNNKSEFKTVDIMKFGEFIAIEFILRLVFGETFVFENKNEIKLLNNDAKYIMKQVFYNLPAKYKFYKYLFPLTKTNVTLKNFNKKWKKMVKKYLNEAKECECKIKENDNNNNEKDYGVAWLIWKNCCKKAWQVPFEVFSQTLIEVVYANQDVTVPSMAWVIYYLAHFNKQIINNMNDMNNNSDNNNLDHIINCFIEECARLSPIFPMSMQQITTKEKRVKNNIGREYVIPKGTLISLDFVSLGLNELEWNNNDNNKDLNEFDCMRFDNILKDKRESHLRISKFGLGARRCPGMKLAQFLMSNFIKYLLKHYIIKPSQNNQHVNASSVPLKKDMAFLAPDCTIDVKMKPNLKQLSINVADDALKTQKTEFETKEENGNKVNNTYSKPSLGDGHNESRISSPESVSTTAMTMSIVSPSPSLSLSLSLSYSNSNSFNSINSRSNDITPFSNNGNYNINSFPSLFQNHDLAFKSGKLSKSPPNSLLENLGVSENSENTYQPLQLPQVRYFDNITKENSENEFVWLGISVHFRSVFLNEQCGQSYADNVIQYLTSLNKKSIIVIADTIAKHNFMAFDHKSENKAIKCAMELGNQLYDIFKNAMTNNKQDRMSKITILRWNDISDQFLQQNEVINKFYENDLNFQSRIDSVAYSFVEYRSKNSSKKSFLKKVKHSRNYILSEMPLILGGCYDISNNHYRVLLYPTTLSQLQTFLGKPKSLFTLISDVQNKQEFEKLRNELINVSPNKKLAASGWIGLALK